MPIQITLYHDDDAEVDEIGEGIIEEGDEIGKEVINLPSQKAVCDQCKGEGKSSAYLGTFSREDFAEDPDFMEDYMDGAYDRTCDRCGGNRVIDVLDEFRYAQLPQALRDRVEAHWEEERAYNETCRMERMMGA